MLSGLMPQPPYPWLQGTWQNFAGLVEHRRVPHALLLIGQEGIGCEDLAKAMAQLLLCQSPSDGRSCSRCKSCQLAQADSHPDLFLLRPEEKSNVIKVAQVREMMEFTANTAQQGGRKLVVIHPAETMNINAANALLKSLEEPSGDCIFILVAEKAAFLMPTIRSRCARTVIQLPPEEQAVAWLERNRVNNPQGLLKEAGGRPLQVMAWLEQDIWGQKQELQNELCRLVETDYLFIDCAKKVQGYGANWVIEQLLGWVMQAVPQTLVASSMQAQEKAGIVEVLTQYSAARLITFYDSLLNKKRLLLSGANPNPLLMLEEIMMELKGLARRSA